MPATITTAIMGVTNAVLQLVIAFGVTVSDAQNAAITGVVNAILVAVAVLWDQRRKPTPTPIVAK